MKSVLIIVLSIAAVFLLSTCKSVSTTDIFSASFAKEKNKNTAGTAQAKTFTVKAMALHKQKNMPRQKSNGRMPSMFTLMRRCITGSATRCLIYPVLKMQSKRIKTRLS